MSKSDGKQAVMAIYEILKQYSSWDQTLTRKEILSLLKEKYRIVINRNTLSTTLHKMMDFYEEVDQRIVCTMSPRTGPKGEESDYRYGYYFDRDAAKDVFTDEEIAILIDTCLYARNMEIKEAKELITKLRSMATYMQKQSMDYLDDIPEKQFNINKMTTQYINMLRKACSENKGDRQKWVSFFFNYYNAEKKLVSDEKRHVVLPLAVCEANHKYYLICAEEWDEKALHHYRIDLMTKLVNEKGHEPFPAGKQLRKKLHDLPKYMGTHLYMFYDEPQHIELEVPKKNGIFNATFLVDAFGTGANWKVVKETETAAAVTLVCSPNALVHFLMQYADREIRVTGPEEIKKALDKKLKEACGKVLR